MTGQGRPRLGMICETADAFGNVGHVNDRVNESPRRVQRNVVGFLRDDAIRGAKIRLTGKSCILYAAGVAGVVRTMEFR